MFSPFVLLHTSRTIPCLPKITVNVNKNEKRRTLVYFLLNAHLKVLFCCCCHIRFSHLGTMCRIFGRSLFWQKKRFSKIVNIRNCNTSLRSFQNVLFKKLCGDLILQEMEPVLKKWVACKAFRSLM